MLGKLCLSSFQMQTKFTTRYSTYLAKNTYSQNQKKVLKVVTPIQKQSTIVHKKQRKLTRQVYRNHEKSPKKVSKKCTFDFCLTKRSNRPTDQPSN